MKVEIIKMEITEYLKMYRRGSQDNEKVINNAKAFVRDRLSEHKYTPQEALYAMDCINNFESLINYTEDLPYTGEEILSQFNDEVFTVREDVQVNDNNVMHLDKNSKQIIEFIISSYNKNGRNETEDFMEIVNEFLELPKSKLEIKNKETIKNAISRFLQFIKQNELEELSGKKILEKYSDVIFKDIEFSLEIEDGDEPEI